LKFREKYKKIIIKKSKSIKYTFNKRTNKIKITVRNLAYNKIAILKIKAYK